MLGTADEVPSDQWRTRPKDGAWSAAEIIAHLIMVERSVVGKADRVIQHPPRKFSRLQKLHLPLALVEARLVRRNAPMAVDPEMIGEKETMLAELREIRERLLAFIDETKERNLGVYRWQHPFLGSLNTYEWMRWWRGMSCDTRNRCGKSQAATESHSKFCKSGTFLPAPWYRVGPVRNTEIHCFSTENVSFCWDLKEKYQSKDSGGMERNDYCSDVVAANTIHPASKVLNRKSGGTERGQGHGNRKSQPEDLHRL